MNTKADHVRAAPNATGHTCHAHGCTKQIKPSLFMCGRHWWMVPVKLRATIWKLYRPGQEADKQPSREYVEAAKAAIEAVRAKETS